MCVINIILHTLLLVDVCENINTIYIQLYIVKNCINIPQSFFSFFIIKTVYLICLKGASLIVGSVTGPAPGATSDGATPNICLKGILPT